ncbi:MAG: TonB-dependent receptor, partial [Candidatus Eremiobacteraeota bacterium]|nr:TonB-dependent receptor [Candidatus Eremiobacteraeota bacterium]
LIPQLVSYVEFRKGPYYADAGDSSAAGSYGITYVDALPAPLWEFGLGSYGYANALVAGSPRIGAGNLLYAFQVFHDNGSFARPDEYAKFNGVLRWSRSTPTSEFSVTAMGYHGTFASSDQLPQRLVADGELDPYGLIDPYDGGTTYRYSLSTLWQRDDAGGTTKIDAYGFEQYLNLFSDFTYYLDDATDYYNVTRNPITCTVAYTTCSPGVQRAGAYTSYCPANNVPGASSDPAHSIAPAPFVFACGDQREQRDKRLVSGASIARAFASHGNATATAGIGVRNDNISTVGLFLVHDDVPYRNGTLGLAHVVQRDLFGWVQTALAAGKVRLVPGLRADLYHFDVAAQAGADSGIAGQAMIEPKLTAAYALSPHAELYADWGESFHSNDARGLFETVDPQTHMPYNAVGQPVQQVSPLVRADGQEIGCRYSKDKLNSTIALWQLHLNSELVFDGDNGTTYAGGPTLRRGIEFANFYEAAPGVTLDADIATSNARFLTDPQHLGTYVPESINAVTAIGATVDRPNYSAAVRMRYFGPRVLDQSGSAVSSAAVTYDAQYTWKTHRGFDLVGDLFNIFNAQSDDVEYYYNSWLPQDANNPAFARNVAINPALGGAGIADYHFHPSQKRSFRLTYVVRP